MYGPIADSVIGRREPAPACLADEFVHLLFIGHDHAAIVRFSFVWVDHERRSWTERPIREDFQAAKPEPVIAKTPTQLQSQRVLDIGVIDVLDDAQTEPSLLMQ